MKRTTLAFLAVGAASATGLLPSSVGRGLPILIGSEWADGATVASSHSKYLKPKTASSE